MNEELQQFMEDDSEIMGEAHPIPDSSTTPPVKGGEDFSNLAGVFDGKELTSEPSTSEDFSELAGVFEPSPIERNEEQLHTDDTKLTSELSNFGSIGQALSDTYNKLSKDVQAGWDQSITGMIYSGEVPKAEEDKTMFDQVVSGIVQGTIDMPYNMAGLAMGMLGGGNPASGMAGAFALPGVFRKAYVDHLEKGEIKDMSEFACRLGSALKVGAEEAMTGAAMSATGGLVNPALKVPIEALTMTTVSSLLHEKMPSMEEFATNAATIIGLHIANPVSGVEKGIEAGKKGIATYAQRKMRSKVEDNLMHLYKEKGITPEQVIKDMQEDPSIIFDMLAHKKQVPRAYLHDVPVLKPTEHTNLSYAVDNNLIKGTEIWRYSKAEFDELLRDGKDLDTFSKQSRFEIGRKIVEDLGTEDLQEIANYYQKKYKFPVEFHITEKPIPYPGPGMIAGQIENPKLEVDIPKRGLNDLGRPIEIEINTQLRQSGIEYAVSTLRHEIEHALDMQKRWTGTASADWSQPRQEANQSKTPVDRLRTATNDPQRHHREYANFEFDYLHKAMVRDALENGEKVPETVLYDYPDLQEYTKIRADQKIVIDPEAVEKVKGTLPEQASKAIDKFYEFAVDDLNPLKRMEINLMGAKSADSLDTVLSVYKTARIARGQIGKAKQYFEYGGFDRKTFENNSKAFKKIVDQVPKEDYDGFVQWLVMQRAVELESQGMKSGFENVADKTTIVSEGSKKGYDAVFKDLRDYQNSLLRQLVDSDIITEKQFTDMTTMHRFYVPFQRELGESMKRGKQSNSSLEAKKVLYKYKGSSKPVVNPLYAIVDNTFQILRAAENNTIMQKLVGMMAYDKEGAYVQKLDGIPLKLERDGKPKKGEPVDKFVVAVKGIEGKEHYGVIEKEMQKGPNKGKYKVAFKGEKKARYLSEADILRWEGKKKDGTHNTSQTKVKNATMIDDVERLARGLNKGIEELRPEDFVDNYATIKVWEKGVPKFYKVHEDIAMTLKNMDTKIPKLLKLVSGPASWLRVGATLNPDFPATNFFKDQIDAFAFAKHGYVPIIDTLRGLSIRKSQGEVFQTWLKSGGYNSVLVALDKPHLGKRMFEELQKLPVNNKFNFSKNPMHYLRALSELSEEGTRLGVFNKALKKGATEEDAAFQSRDTTIDFSKAGIYGRKYNVITAFFNASVQGNAKLFEQMKLHPTRLVSRALLSVTLPSVVNMLTNYNDPEYWKIPAWQRDLFWCVKVNDTWLRFPKPFILGTLFGTIPERLIGGYLTQGNENQEEAFRGFGATLMDAFTPPIVPTVASPFWDMHNNKDRFTGQPLIPSDMEDTLPELQYTRSTGDTARLISKALTPLVGTFTLGDAEHTSPIEVRHTIQSWTGGLGRHALNLTDMLLKKSGVQLDEFNTVAPSVDMIQQIPVVRAFVVRSGSTATADMQRFFDRYEKYQKINKGIILEKKRMHFENVAHLMDESDFGMIQGVYSSMMDIFHVIRNLENMPNIDGKSDDDMADWKRQQIEALYKQADMLSGSGNKVIDAVESNEESRKDSLELFFSK